MNKKFQKIVNMEIKAKSSHLDEIRMFLKKNCTLNRGTDEQTDTYFHSKIGRLKLREGNIEHALIHYVRNNVAEIKQSDILLSKQSVKSDLKEILKKSNGIKVIVKKSREIYFIDNIKFHLDTVKGLGSFVEIEAIDDKGSYTLQHLQDQCETYMKIFKIFKEDLIDCSYSDLVLEKVEKFQTKIQQEYNYFINHIHAGLSEVGLTNFHEWPMDHICYRVETDERYIQMKNELELNGDLLIESLIGGRKISTYKLHIPLMNNETSINQQPLQIIELAAPKMTNKYQEGFEHAEFIIKEKFDDFIKKHSKVKFELNGASKKINPELRVKLSDKYSVKFHHQSLEHIIQLELEDQNS